MRGMWFRRQQRTRPSNLSLDDIVPHLQTTCYYTVCFVVAWGWDLTQYSLSHALHNQNPLRNQLVFVEETTSSHRGSHAYQWAWLILEYLLVCGVAAVVSHELSSISQHGSWQRAAVTAVEFFPSPVFAGKLMGYLGQLPRLGALDATLLNFLLVYLAATLAHMLPILLKDADHYLERFRLTRFVPIVQNTLGFGLGIAWNVLLRQIFGVSDDKAGVLQLLGLALYLAVVSLVTFRIAALVKEEPVTVWDRHLCLLLFAGYVVCAFTLVGFLRTLLHAGWIGSVEALWILLTLAACMSALVAQVDLDPSSDDESIKCQAMYEGPFRIVMCFVMLIPCVWCCCPIVPLFWLLADSTETFGVKVHWYKLISMVAGLASSIEASGLLTDLTNHVAAGFCTDDYCSSKWLFVGLQIVVAVVTTAVLLPVGARLSSDMPATDEEAPPSRERESLLQRVRGRLRPSK